MTQEEKLRMLKEARVFVAGDMVLEKNVEYEVNNVEPGGIAIQNNYYNGNKEENITNKPTTIEKTEDVEQDDKDSKSYGSYYAENISEELKDVIDDRLKNACKQTPAGPAVAKILLSNSIETYLDIKGVKLKPLWRWLCNTFGLTIQYSAFHDAMINSKNRNSSE